LLDGQWENVACLDLFAGTGALGFEAASRGAGRVVMVEADDPAVQQLQATREKLRAAQVTVLRGDALAIAQNLATRIGDANARFDVIFLDPPYHRGWLAKMLPVCERLLTDDGLVYAEAEQSLSNEAMPGWQVVRADKAGMVFYHLLRRNEAD
jgi:16S rRNA (guanine(966)-N(2))-methyltransferase RsmD